MNEPFSEELLSGYLDDELTSEERASVDQWLAASSDNRRLLDDLLAIRRELQALPQQHLDADFSERVLAAIRNRSGNAGVSGAAVDPGAALSQLRPPLGRPAWQWFSAGVAAALACMILGLSLVPESLLDIAFLPQPTHWVAPAATLRAPGTQLEPSQQESLEKSFEQLQEHPQRDTRLQRKERAPAAVDTLTLEKSRAAESRDEGMKQNDGRFASPALVEPGTPVLGDSDGEAADAFSARGASIGRSRQERATFGTREAAKEPTARDHGDRWGSLVAETVAAGEQGQLVVEVPSGDATQSAVTRKLQQRTLTAQTSKGVGDNVQLRGSEEQSANQASDRFYLRQASDAWLDLQVASVEFVGPAEQVQQLLEELQHEQPQELLAAVEISLGDQQRTELAAAASEQAFAKSFNAASSATPAPAPASAGATKDAARGSVNSDSASADNTQEKALSTAPATPLLEAGEREQAADKAPPGNAGSGKRGASMGGSVRRSTQLAKPGAAEGRRMATADKKQAATLVRVRLTFIPTTAAREVPQADVQPQE